MLEQGIRNPEFGADKFGFRDLKGVNWNFLEPELYECALKDGEAQVTSGGALCAETGMHTGRSPKDKYIVCDDQTEQTIWWENNGKMTPAQFARLYQDFIAHSAGKTCGRGNFFRSYLHQVENCSSCGEHSAKFTLTTNPHG